MGKILDIYSSNVKNNGTTIHKIIVLEISRDNKIFTNFEKDDIEVKNCKIINFEANNEKTKYKVTVKAIHTLGTKKCSIIINQNLFLIGIDQNSKTTFNWKYYNPRQYVFIIIIALLFFIRVYRIVNAILVKHTGFSRLSI